MRTKWSLAWAATLLVAVGCAGIGPDRIDVRFPHRIEFETRGAHQSDTDTLDITELRGTRPKIERGGEYVLREKYRLGSFEKGDGSIVLCNICFGSGDTLHPSDVATGQG
jgi:hypothetical protein